MAELSWRHHALIQALMSRGPLSQDDFYSLFSSITGKNPAKHSDLFHGALLNINKELAYVQFELRGCRDQYDGKVYYGAVNNVPDEQSKLGTKYSVSQIAFYKAVIEAIAQDVTTQGCITNIEALNVRLDNQSSEDGQTRIPSSFKSFSMSQKEKTLNDLIRDQWLCSPANGKIGLGIRSFLDLRSWFRSNGYPSCDVCNEPAVKTATCSNEGCNVRIHEYCLKKKFAQRNVSRVCPGCGNDWPPLEFADGEEEAEANAPEESQMPSCGAATRKRLRNFKTEAVEAAQTKTGLSQSDDPSVGLRRTRRSLRIK